MSDRHDFSDSKCLARINELGTLAGCTVERAPKTSNSAKPFRSKILLVNGRQYEVHHVRFIHRAQEGIYSHCRVSRLSLGKFFGVIVLVQAEGYTERIFIIPSSKILEAHGDTEGRYISLYPPLLRKVSKTNSSRLDWWKHENAWTPNMHRAA